MSEGSDGFCLKSDEIEEIFDHFASQFYASNNLPELFVIDINSNNPIEELFLKDADLQRLINCMRETSSSFVKILIIHNNTHWYTCVIRKDELKCEFFLADSFDRQRIEQTKDQNSDLSKILTKLTIGETNATEEMNEFQLRLGRLDEGTFEGLKSTLTIILN